MSREIKFRAWNGEQMVSPDYITRDGIGYWREDSIPSYSTDLMQFTGLKDKNGVDIYEGDTFNYRNNIFKVTFKGDRFGLEVLNQEKCSGTDINKHYSLYLISNIIEGVGNIHENEN